MVAELWATRRSVLQTKRPDSRSGEEPATCPQTRYAVVVVDEPLLVEKAGDAPLLRA